jgi:hypothetical protein
MDSMWVSGPPTLLGAKPYSYNCPLWNIEGFEKWSDDFGNLCHLQEEWIMVKRGCAFMAQKLRGVSKRICWSLAIAWTMFIDSLWMQVSSTGCKSKNWTCWLLAHYNCTPLSLSADFAASSWLVVDVLTIGWSSNRVWSRTSSETVSVIVRGKLWIVEEEAAVAHVLWRWDHSWTAACIK